MAAMVAYHLRPLLARLAFLCVAALAGGGLAAARFISEGLFPVYDDSDIVSHAAGHHGSPEFATRWAILVAGSSGYGNYRHQADVCHAYHVLKRGGLKDENIIVFMFDDIADNPLNPHPGVIINNPGGKDVYAGVPKDYTGNNVTVDNFLAAFLGNKSGVLGGSGKVIDSGPDDHIFMFYSDHGGPGVIGMPTTPNLFAVDLVEAFKKKHAARGFKEMVVYLEACESGSMFEGLLPDNIGVYATTASNAIESSWGTYCPGMVPPPPPEYLTCLGDLYSVSWMEDSEMHNLKEETLKDQYETVKMRTSNYNTYTAGSHVMQYGTLNISNDRVYDFIGSDPTNENSSATNDILSLPSSMSAAHGGFVGKPAWMQRDSALLYLWHKYKRAPKGTRTELEARWELLELLAHRRELERQIRRIGVLLFREVKGVQILEKRRPPPHPVVDNWDCLKAVVQAFEVNCGLLKGYDMKHIRALANICNEGIDAEEVSRASIRACSRSSQSYSSI